jgi:AhpC/TSA antioxidant enzyme
MGVGLVFLGSGNAMMAADFREQQKLDVPVWVDPKRVTYQYLGFQHSYTMLFNPRLWLNGLRAFKAGFRQTKTQGDPWQQGGVLVVRRGGALEWAYASATAGDHPPLDLVFEQAKKASLGNEGSAVPTLENG